MTTNGMSPGGEAGGKKQSQAAIAPWETWACYAPHSGLVIAQAAAVALVTLKEHANSSDEDDEERAEVDLVTSQVRQAFTRLGVVFDLDGNPIAPQTPLMPSSVLKVQGQAHRLAFETVDQAILAEGLHERGYWWSDLRTSMFWEAFNSGGLDGVSLGFGGAAPRGIRPEVHAVDKATDQCLGLQEL